MITLGSADANPTTILEAMAWGLIPVCSVQSGYEGFSSIRNISIDCMDDAVATIKHLQKTTCTLLPEAVALALPNAAPKKQPCSAAAHPPAPWRATCRA